MNKNRRGLSRLLPFLRPQLKTLLLCLLMVLLVNAAELAKPYILEVVIDRYLTAGRPDQGLDAVWVLALGYMACVALSSVLNVSEAVMVNRMGQSILMDIRRRVFNHIQHMSMKTLDHFSSGRLITRATNDVETLNELFSDVLVNLFKDVFMLLGIVVMMLWMNWRLALVAFAVVPLIALITVLVRGRLRRNFVRLKALTGQINGFFSENMSGMRLVQIFRKEKEKHAEFDELNYGYYKAARLQVRMNSLHAAAGGGRQPARHRDPRLVRLRADRPGHAGDRHALRLHQLHQAVLRAHQRPGGKVHHRLLRRGLHGPHLRAAGRREPARGHRDRQAPGNGRGPRGVPARLVRLRGENWVLKDVSFTIEPGSPSPLSARPARESPPSSR